MNPPESVADSSLLQWEPLLSHIVMHESARARSECDEVVSSFVKAMQENAQAALASKKWACFVFADSEDAPLDQDSLEVTDQGEELYRVFFNYQLKLHEGLQHGDVDKALKYQSQVVRNGMGVVKLKYVNSLPNAKRATRGSAIESKFQGDYRSVATKGKRRKASSQKHSVMSPSSDASEDANLELSRSQELVVACAISHRSKRPRIASRLLALETQAVRNDSVRGSGTTYRETGSAEFPLSHRNHNDAVSGVYNKATDSHLERLSKAKLPIALPAHSSKRLRRSSMSALGAASGEVSEAALNSQERSLQRSTDPSSTQEDIRAQTCRSFQRTVISSSTQENIHTKAETRKKRSRLEFESSTVEPREDASTGSFEPLGLDTRRTRPLPRIMSKEHSVPSANKDTVVFRVRCRSLSLERASADGLLRDAASNALVFPQEEVKQCIPDWTQDKELEAEYEDLNHYEQNEADDFHPSVTSAPSGILTKPSVPAPPRIWAQTRQEVCESFEHFRSYHSGVYSKDDIVRGYLLGAFSASRDTFHHGGKLIISHGGGKSESILDARSGPRRYQTDQDQEASDKSVRALLKTCKERRPLVLLADDKYALFPYDLTSKNYTYVVLGLYWISHAWAECQPARDGSGRIVRWKFSFQWCEGQGDPWWTPHQEMTPEMPTLISNPRMSLTKDSSHLGNDGGNSEFRCENCLEQSPFIYKEGWMCLNPQCNAFWTINGEEPKQLDYREEFLNLLPFQFERLPDITPTRAVETSSGVTTTFAFSKGWHCVKCGRLSCRFKWEHWECSSCEVKHVVPGRVRLPKEFWHQRPPKDFLHSRIGKDSGIFACRLEPIDLGTARGFTNRLTFILPHSRGKIHLVLGTPLSNGDADNIFQLYQQQASSGELKLRRYPLRNHRARGQLLTNYFSQNSGEPYQYVGGTGNTIPFHEAPECVRRALAVIKEKVGLALGTDIPFNEVLSAAYMERQKMSFHSDSEKGLGPVVASLSLGSAALMHFRLHVNAENPKGKSTYALTLVLRHGDVLIMEGEGVQEYYEHTVIPMNFRIAATARCIGST